ncbi:MAG: sigma-54-dependent transcriptional regulator, partial [Candidatus Helarchaeota archaeon]
DLVLLDIRLNDEDPHNQEGIDLLKQFLEHRPDMPVVMISAYGDVDQAVECMKLGAADFVEKKAGLAEIRQRLKNALERSQIYRRAKQLEEYLEQREPLEIVGESPAIQELKRLIQLVGKDGHISVLIRGETGTGKELVAKAIHRWSWRAQGPFIAVPLVSTPETLIESELFGYEAGTFTDAKKRKIGWIERAHGGVLFLDEIGDLPMEVQVKLLRFLEEREFTRLGSTSPIKVDVQVVSATHQNLEQAVAEKSFREDLYFRLKGIEIVLPPLRERKEDIPLFARHFLQKLKKDGRTKIESLSKEALESLMQYSWPGNIRELYMTIERAVLFADSNGHTIIEIGDLPSEISKQSIRLPSASKPQICKDFNLNRYLARVELSCIEQALQLANGRKTQAWKILGLNDRFALRRRVKIILEKFPSLKDEFVFLKKFF